MQEIRRRREVAWLGVRAHAPQVVRVLALAALVAGIAYVGLIYYRSRGRKSFVMIPGKAELSTNVVRRVENYERRVNEGDRQSLYVRAAVATSYDDGHHELTGVHIEYLPEGGQQPHKIDSRQAVYFNETELVAFSGNVQIETADRLKVNSEALNYDVKNERAEVQVPLQFSRENVSGRADAATVEGKQKKLALRGNVEIKVEPGTNAQAAQGQDVQGQPPPSQPPQSQPPQSQAAGAQVAKLSPRERPVTIRAPRADYDHARSHLVFSGGATAEQERDVMSGDTLSGFIDESRRLRRVETRGNSYLRTLETGRAAEVRAADMDFFLDAGQRLERALASRQVTARSLDSDAEMVLSTPTETEVLFGPQGDRSVLKEMRAGGRPVVTLSAPRSRAGDANAANKRLTADSVKLLWRETGRDLLKAEAVGNAELIVEPVQQTAKADRKQLNAPRFDCDFFETDNLARLFTATGGAKAVITPVLADQKRGVRTVTSKSMLAFFERAAQDAERVEAQGEAVFNEGDRNGQADNATYTTADATVRLRGGDPIAWDSRARLKAAEIDTNSQTKITYARGRVQTTYYSQEQTGGATPFSKVKSPVFVNSNEAEFQHETGLGVYTGEARAWQDDNFVRGDRITIRREQRRMEADGRVQSALYRAQRKDASGARTVVPVFATSARMFYSDADRLLHYEGSVDIKQGTERINADAADVLLQKEQNEVERMIAQRNVVLTQPGKRGTGDRAEYVAADETVMLTGSPARVEDPEQGSNEGPRITVYLRENRAVTDSPTVGGRPTGRVRSVHKVKKQ